MTPEQWAQAEEMWLTGTMTDAQVGALVGCSGNSICQTARRKGWTRSPEAKARVRERLLWVAKQRLKPTHIKHRARRLSGVGPLSSGLSSHAIDKDFDT